MKTGGSLSPWWNVQTMIERLPIAGVLVTGLAVALLGAAPHQREPRADRDMIPAAPPGMASRVFARADGVPDPTASPPSAEASPAPAEPAPPVEASPHAASTPSAEVAARARAEFDANRSGKIDRTRYTDEMNGIISAPALAQAAAQLKTLGTVKTFTQVRKVMKGPLTIYVFRIECEKPPPIEESIAWNTAGKVEYLSFGPVL